MPRNNIYPYKMGSKSAKSLADGLGIKRIRANGRYRPRRGDITINWGNGVYPIHVPEGASTIINHPRKVEIAGNKLLAFNAMKNSETTIPRFTTSMNEAARWQREGSTIVARTFLRGHSGRGIVLCKPDDDLPEAPLYVEYVKKKEEYRVHVVNGVVIDYVQKKVKAGSDGNNFQIRSYDNGWIFSREGVVLPADVKKQALLAVEALGLDFGAVDVGYNIREEVATVYEINTAPGLEGQTIASYVSAFRAILAAR